MTKMENLKVLISEEKLMARIKEEIATKVLD